MNGKTFRADLMTKKLDVLTPFVLTMLHIKFILAEALRQCEADAPLGWS
jgi:hypothetical protein